MRFSVPATVHLRRMGCSLQSSPGFRYHVNNSMKAAVIQVRCISSLPSPGFRYLVNNSVKAAVIQVRFISSSQRVASPYEILNVPRTATMKEIKLAYFREAKKHHPDLNPGDAKAKEKFQRVAAAYEILSDETKRESYDTHGSNSAYGGAYGGTSDAGQGHAGYNTYTTQNAEDIFNSVRDDLDVVTDAFTSYTKDVSDDILHAYECVKIRDWKGLYEVVDDNKGIIGAVVVPTIVFLRYPPFAFAALRMVWFGAKATIAGASFVIFLSRLSLMKLMKLMKQFTFYNATPHNPS